MWVEAVSYCVMYDSWCLCGQTWEVNSKTQDIHFKNLLSFFFFFHLFTSDFTKLVKYLFLWESWLFLYVVLKKRLAVQFVALVYFPTAIPGYLLAMTGYIWFDKRVTGVNFTHTIQLHTLIQLILNKLCSLARCQQSWIHTGWYFIKQIIFFISQIF